VPGAEPDPEVVEVVGFVVVVVGPVVVVVGPVVVVVGPVVVVVGPVVVVVVTFEAGRSAMVAATGRLPKTAGAHELAASTPASTPGSVATAVCEFPELLTVAPRTESSGASATNLHALLPSPSTRVVPEVSVVTLGDTNPGCEAEASIGLVSLTPENATVTIETWVGGLTRA
jgi:hypothetical protein